MTRTPNPRNTIPTMNREHWKKMLPMSHPVTIARNALHHKDTILGCRDSGMLMKQACHAVGVRPETLRGYCRVLGIPLWWQEKPTRKAKP